MYAGRGSSHSWTWLADLFERSGVFNVRFLDEVSFVEMLASGSVGLAIISGGDGFMIADALKGEGFRRLERFIRAGRTYAGICAGAYLPLPSSIPPFSEFNISSTKIENVDPNPQHETSVSPRMSVPYGSCAIVHPVRGALVIGEHSRASVLAPLYGGPVFREPEHDVALMRYLSFTPGTEFQVEKEMAPSLILGKTAVVKVFHGDGKLVLFGPHLEHPRFPAANELFLKMLGFERTEQRKESSPVREGSPSLLRSITGLKVAIYGLENRSFVVGRKAWDGGRLLELADAIEKRASNISGEVEGQIQSRLNRLRELLITLKMGTDSDADECTQLLVEAARICVDSHFEALAQKGAN